MKTLLGNLVLKYTIHSSVFNHTQYTMYLRRYTYSITFYIPRSFLLYLVKSSIPFHRVYSYKLFIDKGR